jgi:hypothetical protein
VSRRIEVRVWHIADRAAYLSLRAEALYRALGVALDDEDYVLMKHEGGCFALVGLTVDGHRYAIEVES